MDHCRRRPRLHEQGTTAKSLSVWVLRFVQFVGMSSGTRAAISRSSIVNPRVMHGASLSGIRTCQQPRGRARSPIRVGWSARMARSCLRSVIPTAQARLTDHRQCTSARRNAHLTVNSLCERPKHRGRRPERVRGGTHAQREQFQYLCLYPGFTAAGRWRCVRRCQVPHGHYASRGTLRP